MATYSETPLARRIRLLMAKAQGTDNEHEAAAFMAKVQEMLVDNGLSMSDVKKDDEVERGDIGLSHHKDVWKSPSRRQLLRAVCRYYMCEAIGPGRQGMSWTIIGRPHNVEVAVSMTDYLVKTTVRMSNKWGREHPGANIIDFRKGCMLRLVERLLDMLAAQQQTKAEWKAGNPGNLPALYDSENRLVRAFKEANVATRPARRTTIKAGQAGLEAGRAAGGTISLHGQVGQGNGRIMIGKDK
jgi:Protein of unknown function (DUF2786)